MTNQDARHRNGVVRADLHAGAMGLPVSGFPNMNAVALEDSTGQTFVATMDFIKVDVIQ